MFSARIKTTSETQILSIGSPAVTIKQTNSSVVASGGTLYINGTSGSTAKNNEWNHYILVLPSPIEIGDGIEITIGKTTGTPVFYIDNLSFMEYQLTSDDALTYYRLLYSEVSEKINYSSENIEINVMDSESVLSNDSSKSYQIYKNEGLLKRVDLASTENHTLSSGTINFSTNRNLIAIDGVTLTGGELVLLGNQTNASDRKIYSVSITGSVATFTPDPTTINTGDIVYVKSSKSSFVGDENEESFIQKQSDGTFIQIDDPLDKVSSFDYNSGVESFLSTAE
jgi:co-chaperonin GroES (HSP10)